MKRFSLTLLLALSITTPSFADANLAKTRNCMACHAVEKKLVGPSFKDVANKYAGQDDAINRLATKIMQGGGGVWGPVPMPANPNVSSTEAKQLATWVLSFKRP